MDHLRECRRSTNPARIFRYHEGVSYSSDLQAIIGAGIESVRPGSIIPSLLKNRDPVIRPWLDAGERYLLCLGKASVDCAKVVLASASCNDYFVLSPYDDPEGMIRVYRGSHPVPDARSYESTQKLVAWLRGISSGSELLVLLSGGSSALCMFPLSSVALESKMRVHDLLIRSGASIQEINAVRKHLSLVKGGRLAQIAGHLHTAVLVISDVIGDDLATIGSGPFYADATTFLEAKGVLLKHDLWMELPEDARRALEAGIAGNLPETPKPGTIHVHHEIIASNAIARNAAATAALNLGYTIQAVTGMLKGDVENAARVVFEQMKDAPKKSALIWGGEITVRLKGHGTGGRNQHLALLMTEKLSHDSGWFAAAGTDGIDGNSPAAGAWTDNETFDRASGVQAYETAAQNFDSYEYFKAVGQNIVTGPTGTNVMDLYVAIT